MRTRVLSLIFGVLSGLLLLTAQASSALVLMTDFGTEDGAVSAMHGVAYGVDSTLVISEITHSIPDYNIWAGAYRLFQTADYWPEGTVFVTVVDPGVGTQRKSIVLKTKNGRYYVGPNNGLYTLIAERDGIAEIREIDEKVNRLPGSEASYTFHGRDVYAYTGARLASGLISFEQVGPALPESALVAIPYQHAIKDGDTLRGVVPVLDVKYGNVWTNIPKQLLDELGVNLGDKLRVTITHGRQKVEIVAPYANTFGTVARGKPLIYANSLLNVSIALNQANFAAHFRVESGPDWLVAIRKSK